jgi:dGTP triphosphohydrolase
MIRIPFLGHSSELDAAQRQLGLSSPGNQSWDHGSAPQREQIEARIAALELRLVDHAEELTQQLTSRVERIQSRVERALLPFSETCEGSDAGAQNVVEFTAASSPSHYLHSVNAREALHDLTQALLSTSEHLDALGRSVARMKQSVGKA